MKWNGSFAKTSPAGILLAVMITAGTAHSLPCLACEVTSSYHAAIRVYDKARMWTEIARWWISPEYAPATGAEEPSPKSEEVCQARPADARVR
jgi:hypothetical protein